MSGTFPASPAPARVELRSLQPALVSLGHSLRRQSRTLNAQRWALRLVFAPMTQAQFAPIYAFAIAQRGQYDTFSYQLLSRVWPLRGAGGGSPTVNNQAGSPEELQTGSRNVVTAGWPTSTNVLLAGDLVQYAGHTKIYMVTATVTSGGGGAATITQEPALVAGPTHGAALTIGPNVVFNCALAADLQSAEITPRGGSLALYRYEVELVEAY